MIRKILLYCAKRWLKLGEEPNESQRKLPAGRDIV